MPWANEKSGSFYFPPVLPFSLSGLFSLPSPCSDSKKSPCSRHRKPPPPAHNGVPAAGSPLLSASLEGQISQPSRTRRLSPPLRSHISQGSSPTRSSSRRAPTDTGLRRRGRPPLLRPSNHRSVAPPTSGGALLSHQPVPRLRLLQLAPTNILCRHILTTPCSSGHRREPPSR